MARITRTVIFDERLYAPGGQVHRWVKGVTRTFGEAAKAQAPVRSGRLRRGIQTNTRNLGTKRIEGWIKSNAPYTTFVIHGTASQGAGYIYSRRGWEEQPLVDAILARGYAGKDVDTSGLWMTLPPPGRRFHLRVHGQKANNFLFRAWNITARRHRAIRGVSFPL